MKKNSIKSGPFVTSYNDYVQETYLRLYLYVTEKGLRNIIKEQKIRLSCPWRTNDITEGVAQGEQAQNEWIKSYGYVCFSAVCDSPSMWGYYADKGRGACLVFDFPVCQRNEEDNSGKEHFLILRHGLLSPNAKGLHKIKYQQDRLPQMKNSGDVAVLLTKSLDWQHENEYRILYRLSDVMDTMSYNDSETGRTEYYDATLLEYLSGIVLGPRCILNIAEVETEIVHSGKLITSEEQIKYFPSQSEQIWRKYLSNLGLSKAKIIRAELDLITFAYNVPVTEIKAKKDGLVSNVIINLLNIEQWYKPAIDGEQEYSLHHTWLMTDEFHAHEWHAYGPYQQAWLVRCRACDSDKTDKIGLCLIDNQGDKYIIPYVNSAVLQRLYEKAVDGAYS